MDDQIKNQQSLEKIRFAFLGFKKILSDLRLKRQKTLADFLRRLEEEKLESLRRKLKN